MPGGGATGPYTVGVAIQSADVVSGEPAQPAEPAEPLLEEGMQGLPAEGVAAATSTHRLPGSGPEAGPGTGHRLPAGGTLMPPHLILGVNLPFLRRFAQGHGLSPTTSVYELTALVVGHTPVNCSVGVALLAGREEGVLGKGTGAPPSPPPAAELVNPALRWDGGRLPEPPKASACRPRHPMPSVGPAGIFVIHAHACSYVRMVGALEEYTRLHKLDEEGTYFWVDAFSLNLHNVMADLRFIAQVIRTMPRAALVMDPWQSPVCLRRAWCLYEILCAKMGGVAMAMTLCPEDRRDLQAALARQGVPQAIASVVASFDVSVAAASDPSDSERLLAVVATTMPIDEFNGMVREAMRVAFVNFSWAIT